MNDNERDSAIAQLQAQVADLTRRLDIQNGSAERARAILAPRPAAGALKELQDLLTQMEANAATTITEHRQRQADRAIRDAAAARASLNARVKQTAVEHRQRRRSGASPTST